MQTKQKVEQLKAYTVRKLSAVESPHNPFHEAVKDTKGCRLGPVSYTHLTLPTKVNV